MVLRVLALELRREWRLDPRWSSAGAASELADTRSSSPSVRSPPRSSSAARCRISLRLNGFMVESSCAASTSRASSARGRSGCAVMSTSATSGSMRRVRRNPHPTVSDGSSRTRWVVRGRLQQPQELGVINPGGLGTVLSQTTARCDSTATPRGWCDRRSVTEERHMVDPMACDRRFRGDSPQVASGPSCPTRNREPQDPAPTTAREVEVLSTSQLDSAVPTIETDSVACTSHNPSPTARAISSRRSQCRDSLRNAAQGDAGIRRPKNGHVMTVDATRENRCERRAGDELVGGDRRATWQAAGYVEYW